MIDINTINDWLRTEYFETLGYLEAHIDCGPDTDTHWMCCMAYTLLKVADRLGIDITQWPTPEVNPVTENLWIKGRSDWRPTPPYRQTAYGRFVGGVCCFKPCNVSFKVFNSIHGRN